MLIALVAFALAAPAPAQAAVLAEPVRHWPGCQTRACDRRVGSRIRERRRERMVERRIRAVAPLRCYGQPSVIPCWIVTRESRGRWWAWNGTSCGSGFHARGYYQLCGHGEPWPVLVRSRYETLKRKLAHHRIARELWAQGGHW